MTLVTIQIKPWMRGQGRFSITDAEVFPAGKGSHLQTRLEFSTKFTDIIALLFTQH